MSERRIPDRPPVDPIAYGRNHAGGLDPERHRRRSPQIPTSSPGEIVPVADTGSSNLDQNLARARCASVRHLQEPHIATEFFDPRDPHYRSPATYRSSPPRPGACLSAGDEDVLTAVVVERLPVESAIESFEVQARDVEETQQCECSAKTPRRRQSLARCGRLPAQQ